MEKLRVVVLGALLAIVTGSHDAAAATQAKCLVAKTKCVSKALTGLLKCHQQAETPGRAGDPNFGGCEDKVTAKFDGGTTPAKGCFEKLESKLPNDCLSVDDTGLLESAIDSCVTGFVTALDPPPLTQSKCGAGKKKCVANKAKSLLKCHQLAQTPGKPVDVNANGCIDKVELKFDGNGNPAKSCFETLENKSPNDCEILDDAAALEALIDQCIAALIFDEEHPTTTTTVTTVSTSSTSTSTTSAGSTSSTSTSTISTGPTTSSTTTTIPGLVTCGASGLLDARMIVRYDLVGAPALSGVQARVHYPGTTSLPNIPSTSFVDPSRVTNLTPYSPFLLSRDVDTEPNGIEDTIEVLFALTNQSFPPGNLVSIRFDCQVGTPFSIANFPCQVTQASDVVGNDVQNPGTIPCSIAELTPVP